MQIIYSLSEKILTLPRSAKRAVAVATDLALCIISVALAYRLRLDVWVVPTGSQWLSYGIAVALAVPIFVKFGLYRAIFRYIGWHALGAVTRACILYGALYSLVFSVIGVVGVPRSTGLLQPILLFLAVGASRALARSWFAGGVGTFLTQSKTRPVLIYGAGSAGRQLVAGLGNSGEMDVVGFIDDDRRLQGSFVHGKLVSAPGQLIELIDTLAVTDILLAMPRTSRQRRNEIMDSLRGHNVTVRMLPGIFDLADGKVTINDLRPLEIEDLLGRDPVPPEPALMSKCIGEKCVLVTGAGGSIGSELCRQIYAQRPAKLLLVDHSEYNLYAIEQELAGYNLAQLHDLEIVPLLASVREEARIDEIFELYKPHTIYHAAAYKHVPIVELNPHEGVRNNVFGTKLLADLAVKHSVSDFVLISTDKAVRPTNVMGATKRVAEMILQGIAATAPDTCFSMVRFGNVLGSSGSVVPLFRKQIAAGGPVTLTHPDITRFFMTIPEAAQLVIQAGAMARGGEVFVLDMGQPVKIIDLARRMIELSGLTVREPDSQEGDIAIRITGLRPAEKLYEELLIGDNPETTSHPRILKALDPAPTSAKLAADLGALRTELAQPAAGRLATMLHAMIRPDATPA